MQRIVAIALLLMLGLIANQLPILWTSYQTFNQRYATFYCVNPGTSCNGSCTMKRDFVERTSPRSEQGRIPARVVSEILDLSPTILPSSQGAHISTCVKLTSHTEQAERVVSRADQPATPPPRG